MENPKEEEIISPAKRPGAKITPERAEKVQIRNGNDKTIKVNNCGGEDEDDESKTDALVNMGFNLTQARDALSATCGDVDRAAELLLLLSEGATSTTTTPAKQTEQCAGSTPPPDRNVKEEGVDLLGIMEHNARKRKSDLSSKQTEASIRAGQAAAHRAAQNSSLLSQDSMSTLSQTAASIRPERASAAHYDQNSLLLSQDSMSTLIRNEDDEDVRRIMEKSVRTKKSKRNRAAPDRHAAVSIRAGQAAANRATAQYSSSRVMPNGEYSMRRSPPPSIIELHSDDECSTVPNPYRTSVSPRVLHRASTNNVSASAGGSSRRGDRNTTRESSTAPTPPTPPLSFDGMSESFSSLDLSQCPEVSGVAQRLEDLHLEAREVKGDRLQEEALSLAQQGKNIFLTGKAGTGKSWTTKRIVSMLKERGDRIHITAPTGIAAINVGGITIHSWGGFGCGKYYGDFDRMMEKKIRLKIMNTSVLLIDEISMMSGHLFDVLECMVTIIRCYDQLDDRLKDIKKEAPVISEADGGYSQSNNLNKNSIMSLHMLQMRWRDCSEGGLGDLPPWGGMQLIVVGDFFQLPPVPNRSRVGGGVLLENSELWETEYNMVVGQQGCYAFQSYAWGFSRFQTIELTEVYRQQAGNKEGLIILLRLLNDIREGCLPLSQDLRLVMDSLRAPLPEREDCIVPTELHSKNAEVDSRNKMELVRIPGDIHKFKAKDEVEFDIIYKTKLLNKYELMDVAQMPYLWACTDEPEYSEEWREATNKFQELIKRKKRLLEEQNYLELVPIPAQEKALEDEISRIEHELTEKSTITLKSVKSYLKEAQINQSPQILLQRIRAFQLQLKTDFAKFEKHAKKHFFETNCRVAQVFELKVNSQVMLLWNLDLNAKLANGSRGIIICFIKMSDYRYFLNKEISSRAETSKSSNTESKKEEVIDVDNINYFPQQNHETSSIVAGHVPLEIDNTEVTSVDQDTVTTPLNDNASTRQQVPNIDPSIAEKITEVLSNMSTEALEKEQGSIRVMESTGVDECPIVQFKDGQIRVIVPQPFGREFKGCGKAKRWQIPLNLAWAITIHKSQGMTIDWLRVNLEGCFTAGQAYVAMSRGVDVASMVVENFSERQIQVSEEVKKFYDALHKRDLSYCQTTWMDSLENFKNTTVSEARKEMWIRKQFSNEKCTLCGSECNVKQVRSNKNGNRGKWFVSCSQQFMDGHTFRWVVVPSI